MRANGQASGPVCINYSGPQWTAVFFFFVSPFTLQCLLCLSILCSFFPLLFAVFVVAVIRNLLSSPGSPFFCCCVGVSHIKPLQYHDATFPINRIVKQFPFYVMLLQSVYAEYSVFTADKKRLTQPSITSKNLQNTPY